MRFTVPGSVFRAVDAIAAGARTAGQQRTGESADTGVALAEVLGLAAEQIRLRDRSE